MSDPSHPMEGVPLIQPSSVDHPLHDLCVEACRSVFDPEIPVNIYDLGLIYTIDLNAGLGARGHHGRQRHPHSRRGPCLGAALGHGYDERRSASRAWLHVGVTSVTPHCHKS